MNERMLGVKNHRPCITSYALGSLSYRPLAPDGGELRRSRQPHMGALIPSARRADAANFIRIPNGTAIRDLDTALRHLIAVVARVYVNTHADLFEIAHGTEAHGAFLRFGQRGQQHRRQNRDDGDHHKQFDEGKSSAFYGWQISIRTKNCEANVLFFNKFWRLPATKPGA